LNTIKRGKGSVKRLLLLISSFPRLRAQHKRESDELSARRGKLIKEELGFLVDTPFRVPGGGGPDGGGGGGRLGRAY